MKKEEALFQQIAGTIAGAELSQMFGKPCIKINGKAFACFFQDEMVFKLGGDEHAKAIALKGAKLFDPSGKGRAMKEWVQLPFAHQKLWKEMTNAALKYLTTVK